MDKQPAGFWLRLLAMLTDFGLSWLPVSYILSNLSRSLNLPSLFAGIVNLTIFMLFFGLTLALYNVIFTYFFGGTIGKLLTGLRIASVSGEKLTWKQVLFRQLLSYRFSGILFGLGFFAILKDAQKQGWHDKTVGSNVFLKTPLYPLALIVLIGLILANGYLLRTAYHNFTHDPIKGQVLELWSEFQANQKATKAQFQNQLSGSPEISPKITQEGQNINNLILAGKTDEASQSAELMLKDATTNAEKAFAYSELGNIALFLQKDSKTANKYYTQSLTLSDKIPDTYTGLGQIALNNKDYTQAITYEQKCTELQPQADFCYLLESQAYYYDGNQQKALDSIQQALKIHPQNKTHLDWLSFIQKNPAGASKPNPTPTKKTTTQAQSSGPGYTLADVQGLVADLNQADKDTETLKTYHTGPFPNYNPDVVNGALQTIAQRKVLAQELLDKMGKSEPLTDSDYAIWDQYKALSAKQDQLISTLENGNGGY